MNVFSHCYVIQTNAECIVPIGQWVIVADIWVEDIQNIFYSVPLLHKKYYMPSSSKRILLHFEMILNGIKNQEPQWLDSAK